MNLLARNSLLMKDQNGSVFAQNSLSIKDKNGSVVAHNSLLMNFSHTQSGKSLIIKSPIYILGGSIESPINMSGGTGSSTGSVALALCGTGSSGTAALATLARRLA